MQELEIDAVGGNKSVSLDELEEEFSDNRVKFVVGKGG